jgi:ketosteroid isomerase-like protein
MSSAIDLVKELEDRRYAAMIAGDLTAIDELFADNALYTHSYGGVDTKQSFIELVSPTGGIRYRAVHRSNETYYEYDHAVVISVRVHLELTARGEDRDVHGQATAVWLNNAGRWQFAVWHSTPVPPPAL